MRNALRNISCALFTLAVISSSVTCFGQDDPAKKAVDDAFRKAVDKFACLVAVESFNDNQTDQGQKKNRTFCDGEDVQLSELTKNATTTMKLLGKIEALKGEVAPATVQDAEKYFTSLVFDKTEELKTFRDSDKRSDKGLQRFVEKFKQELKKIYQDVPSPNPPASAAKPTPTPTPDEVGWGSWFISFLPAALTAAYISLFLSIFLLLVVAYLFWKNFNLTDSFEELRVQLSRELHKIKNDPSRGKTSAFPKSGSAGSPSIRRGEGVADSSADSVDEETNSFDFSPGAMRASEPEAPRTLFLPSPTPEGWFNNSSKSTSFREGTSIYRLDLRSDTDADFQIHTHPEAIKSALLHPERNIDKVCTSTEFRQPNAVSVQTEQPGRVKLEGDRWMVISKAKVRYSS